MILAADYPLLDLLLTVLWLGLLFAWISLVIQVFGDVFRSDDLSGLGKAGWSLFVVILPFLGVFIYLLARGDKMAERRVKDMEAQQAYAQAYIRDAAGTGSPADQVSALAALHDAGRLTDDEFQKAKAKALNS